MEESDLSQLKHIKEPHRFFKSFLPTWIKMLDKQTENLTETAISKECLAVLDNLTVDAYKLFCVFDNSKFGIVHLSSYSPSIIGYSKAELLEKGSSFFIHLLKKKHTLYLIKLIYWISKLLKNKKAIETDSRLVVIKGIKLIRKDGSELSTLIRYVDPKGVAVQSRVVMEVIDISNLVDDDEFMFRVQLHGRSKAVFYGHSNRTFSKQSDLFTTREYEVLQLMSKGKATQDIAKELFISPRTVSTHKRNMLEKVGAKDATSMIELCKLMGILGL